MANCKKTDQRTTDIVLPLIPDEGIEYDKTLEDILPYTCAKIEVFHGKKKSFSGHVPYQIEI